MSIAALPECIAARSIRQICFNHWLIAQDHILIGLTEWRRGNSPLDAFNAGIDAAEALIAAIAEWHATDGEHYGDADFRLIGAIGYLVGRRIDFGRDQRVVHDFPSVALVQRLLQALYDEPYRDSIDLLLAKLATDKSVALRVDSEQTYLKLLDAAGDAETVAELVTHAEKNYNKRARDKEYSFGLDYWGGELSNPYSVDWELACVLKKIGWEGDSIHKWRWG